MASGLFWIIHNKVAPRLMPIWIVEMEKVQFSNLEHRRRMLIPLNQTFAPFCKGKKTVKIRVNDRKH